MFLIIVTGGLHRKEGKKSECGGDNDVKKRGYQEMKKNEKMSVD